MLSVLRVHLPSDIPIVGCELTPYVLLRRPDKSVTTDDVPESSPLDGHFLRYKWYRIQSDRKGSVCSVHPSEQATLQCLGCVKAKIPVAKSYHCSPKCFSDAWQHHRVLHDRATSAVNENGNEEEELFGRFNSTGSGGINPSLPGSGSSPSLANGSTPMYPAAVTQRSGGETWFEVGRSKTYTPTADDIGHVLKFECVVVDAETKLPAGHVNTLMTSRVIPAPCPSPRRLISVGGIDVMGHLDADGRILSSGTFTVLSYNILSDVYATSESYGYCPSWALSWPYRRQNLLREIVGYRADIVCLQEVQSDHFEEFFSPELDKHGYQALYKRKTAEVFSGNIHTIDGCATFFRRDRFSHVKKYEVEFNKAAQSLTDAVVPSAQKKTALSRLVKDNVALIAVLEAKFSNQGADNPGKRQLLCVANTHVNVHQDLKDVKLWQVHTLLKGLEKIAVSADIPMLVCGDFNAVPGSAPHALLAMGKVDQMHPDLAVDPLGILRPASKLTHQLPLVSAYSSFARMGVGLSLEQQRRKMDPTTNEPLFTNCTRDFIGTLDYIFYTADSLTVESLLELLDEDSLRKDTALPSPEWSSDHIALLAEFRCKSRTRR
ncbi:carbon catabolite repressor protein 4 homolog 1 [Malania oleifera]|uniref:carbon catabolite repressor protein 4 homolog 1 n=1 Tax=Malania oleifera TaxID=397392 RepID=UPI0025AEB581|nr:carbon catabolite repressor protein 4 homolog 1 [Malania oleifera]XP_057984274.1 carbon catabolite repressor protein 4 homolog 1 [Malania oleifera]XP_057984275.1 carbon catabolite repressor protein 4 homolog 1 [Malania oleifera]XP_057984276.1 carbon catabolite repressor protein 4 homolog 1 [Malania oleifera]XP_057984277.1 carbon catabolite repressor protein 4 homolog 1 [Malania oleifera]